MPSSLAELLSLLAPCFTQPTYQTFSMLMVGMIGRIRNCTVTGMLQAAGLAGVWHHSRAHDFFARRRWNPDELGLALLDFLVTVFAKPATPIRLAVDDTLFGRSGGRVWGAHYLHDGAQPEGSGRRTRWGNCWVVVVLVIQLDCLGGRPVGLPILFRLARPKDDKHPDRPSQPELGRTVIDIAIKRLRGRTVELVMDGAYATKAWRGLPDRVTVTTRMRANAAVFKLAPPPTGKRGRPALKGARLGTLAQLAASAIFKPVTITTPDGRTRTEHVWQTTCLWYGPFHTQPITVMLIRKPDRKPKPTVSAKPATASRKQSRAPSRSGSSHKRSRSPGTTCTATPSRHQRPPPNRTLVPRRPQSATPTCSRPSDTNSSAKEGHKHPPGPPHHKSALPSHTLSTRGPLRSRESSDPVRAEDYIGEHSALLKPRWACRVGYIRVLLHFAAWKRVGPTCALERLSARARSSIV
jgi:hypothetical protein